MAQVQEDERAAAILARKAEGLLALDEALVELADANCAAAIAAVIAERVQLKPQVVTQALEADSDESITVMCRAAGFRLNAFSALLRMRRRRSQGKNGASYALTFFSGLNRPAAERALQRIRPRNADRRSR